jgi:predicted CoA-binding protein
LKEIIRFACVFKIEEIEENVREVQIFYNDTKWLEIFENIYTNDAFE